MFVDIQLKNFPEDADAVQIEMYAIWGGANLHFPGLGWWDGDEQL